MTNTEHKPKILKRRGFWIAEAYLKSWDNSLEHSVTAHCSWIEARHELNWLYDIGRVGK